MSQINPLRVQQFLVDRIIQAKIVLDNGVPELLAICLAQKHYCFAGAGAQVVGFFDGVDEEVVDMLIGVRGGEGD
jgi:hypothetical protein